MDTKGKHFIAEMWDIDENILNNYDLILKEMKNAAKEAKGTILNVFGHKFSPQGVSVVITIAESHLSIHTFPEHGYCAIDIYTCGNTLPDKAINYLKKVFHTNNAQILELTRGIKDGFNLKVHK